MSELLHELQEMATGGEEACTHPHKRLKTDELVQRVEHARLALEEITHNAPVRARLRLRAPVPAND